MTQPDKYPLGTRLIFITAQIQGVVVPNYKLPGDVCVAWENGQTSSYDPEFLDQYCSIVETHG